VCEQYLGLKIGVLAGETIYGHKSDDHTRFEAVRALNDEKLDGLVISPKVGGCGHNLIGANHVLFMGSMYSHAYEAQILGIAPVASVDIHRTYLSSKSKAEAACQDIWKPGVGRRCHGLPHEEFARGRAGRAPTSSHCW
jgi:hypothetical protein